MNLVPYFKNVIAPYVRALAGRSERGAALVEYALLVALIAVVCIAAIGFLGESANDKFSEVASEIDGAGS
ncbi:MAG: Flp family type IVb pilin [Acidimicrobiia bacterium]|jgi:pilus assembly protein Flp/PilA